MRRTTNQSRRYGGGENVNNNNNAGSKDILIALTDEEARLRHKLLTLTGDLEEMAQSRESAELDNLRQLQQQISDLELEDRKVVAQVEHHRRSVGSTQRAIQSIESDLTAARRRVAHLRNEIHQTGGGGGREGGGDSKATATASSTPKKSTAAVSSSHGTNSDNDDEELSPEEYSQLLIQVDRAEAKVIALKAQHMRTRDEARTVATEVAEARLIAEKQSATLLELHRLHAEHANLESSAHTKEAQSIVALHRDLQNQLSQKQALIEELHTEKKEMLRHLLEGATQRHGTLKELRSRFLHIAGTIHGSGNSSSAFKEVFDENQDQRHNLVNVYFTMDSEMEALQQYIQVLQKRCEETSQRIHALTFEIQLNKHLKEDQQAAVAAAGSRGNNSIN